jgi:phosphoribosyl 1,2-cyclic phosphate phosphodiesterase
LEHPTHFNADRALEWLAKTRTKRGILTNLHIDMDYKNLSNEIFGNTIVAYDGLEIYI